MRAVYAASAADDGADKHASAYGAGLACVSVDLKERCVSIVLPSALEVFPGSYFVFFNKVRKPLRNDCGELLKVLFAKAVCGTGR